LCQPLALSQSFKKNLVVVVRAVGPWRRAASRVLEPFSLWERMGEKSDACTGPDLQRAWRTRAVSSWTRLYTDLSSRIRRAIFDVAWITVVWSRPPNSLPIFGSDESVSSRERYIATCRG